MQKKMSLFSLLSFLLPIFFSLTSCSTSHSHSLHPYATPYVASSQDATANFPQPPYQHLQGSLFLQEESAFFPDEEKALSHAITAAQIEEKVRAVFKASFSSGREKDVTTALQALSYSHHPLAVDIISQYILSPSPLIQLASLQALKILATERARSIITQALKSDYYLVRLEAIWILLEMKDTKAINHIEALHSKLPDELRVYLPDLYAKEGSIFSLQQLMKLAYNENDIIQAKVFFAIYKNRRYDAEEFVVSFQSHSPTVLEAHAAALELFTHDRAFTLLEKLSTHSNIFVRSRALASRINQGDEHAKLLAQNEYCAGNKYIVAALVSSSKGVTPNIFSSSPLYQISSQHDLDITSIIYLLATKNCAALPHILSLVAPQRATNETTILVSSCSPAGTITWWHTSPEVAKDTYTRLYLQEQSLETQEWLLSETLQQLGDASFITLADALCRQKYVALYPQLFDSLMHVSQENFSSFCDSKQYTLGSALVRSYVALAQIQRSKQIDIPTLKTCFKISRNYVSSKEQSDWRIFLPWTSREAQNDVDESKIPVEVGSKLYLLCCQATLDLSPDIAKEVLLEELSYAPQEVAPFVAVMLLQTLL